MQSQLVILSGGRNPHLLQIRNEVLRVSGHIVVSTHSSSEMMNAFHAGDFDIVIVCHSFNEEERAMVAQAVHAQSPSTPVLAVTAGEIQDPNADVSVSNNDPTSLLDAITLATSGRFLFKPGERVS